MPVETAFFLCVQPIKSSSFGTQESVQRNEGIYLEIHIRVSMIGNGWMAFVRVRIPSWPAKKCFKCIRVIMMAWERKKMNTLVKYLLIHSECCCYSCRGQKIKQHTNDAYKKSAGRIFDSLCFCIGKLGKTRCYSLARSEIATLQVDACTKRGEIFVRHLKNFKNDSVHWALVSMFVFFVCVLSRLFRSGSLLNFDKGINLMRWW